MFKLFSNHLEHAGVTRINAKEAKVKMDEDKDVVVLDVRTKQEYKEVHIPKAVLLPLDNIESATRVIPDKNKTYLVYCLSGSRSTTASKLLAKMGYTNVYNFGGIASWPYETEVG